MTYERLMEKALGESPKGLARSTLTKIEVDFNTPDRRLFQSRDYIGLLNPGVHATLVPPAIEKENALRSCWWYDCG